MSLAIVPGSERQGVPVPYAEYQCVCCERAHKRIQQEVIGSSTTGRVIISRLDKVL